MNTTHTRLCITILAIVSAGGCGTANDTTSVAEAVDAEVDSSLYQLTEEPAGAVGVIAARESTNDGAPLVLMGRVGGSEKPWVDGRAAFTLLDASMNEVEDGEETGEGEICTGDCCATERLNCTTLVKVVDLQGQIVPVDSRKLLGLKRSDMVVVTGTAQKDESGNFVMLAKGVYIRH